MLRSPKASEGQGGALGEAEALKRGNTVGVRDQVMDLVASQGMKVSRKSDNLLPTPMVDDSKNTGHSETRLKSLASETYKIGNDLLPTPIVRDYKDGSAPQTRDGKVSTDTVARAVFNSGEVSEVSWGKFEPAIRRWEEIIGRPAPAPTLPDGKDGAHRLSPWLTEWMMGLPEGWICDPQIGLSRNEQLKAAGNGVVPQQAELALKTLLHGTGLIKGEK